MVSWRYELPFNIKNDNVCTKEQKYKWQWGVDMVSWRYELKFNIMNECRVEGGW